MPPGRPRDPARETAILDATIEVLAEAGYEGLTVEAVAARAGSSKKTIYLRWSTKHELVVEAIDVHRRRVPDEVEPADSLRGDLAARVDLLAKTFEGWDGRVLLALLRSEIGHPKLLADIVARRPDRSRLPDEVVARAVARGELSTAVDPELFEQLVLPIIIDRRVHDRPIDEAFRRLLVDGVLLPAFKYAAQQA